MRSTKSPSWISRIAGSSPVPVPPHVFQVDAAEVRYGGFSRSNGNLEALVLRQAALAEDTFAAGPLGGTLRETAGLDRALQELLAGADQPIGDASLVVPDRWLRLLFTETEQAVRKDREEVWRWKLKSLVPFRVEELRVRGVDVASLNDPDGGGPGRVLLAFAVEQLLAELEDAFGRRGVHIGQITSRSLALMSLLAPRGDNTVVVQLEEDGYSTFFSSAGVPVLVRYRAVTLDPWSAAVEDNLLRDFRIIRSFLNENFPGVRFAEGLLCGPPEAEARWARILEASLDVGTRLLRSEDLRVDGVPHETDWHRLAPMVAAVCEEVA